MIPFNKTLTSPRAGQKNSSTYCDYNDAFKSYDNFRQPHGLRELLQILRQSSVLIREQRILEGGFGTGAYIDHNRHWVKEIYGVEGSEEGCRQAGQKTSDAKNVHLQLGDILQLSFPDEYFHAYMVNQVVHHLDTDQAFPSLNGFLSEARRVLAPGGQLIINTCSQKQLDPVGGVYWHYKFITEAALTLRLRYVPIKELEARLEALGFTGIKKAIPAGQIFYRQYYENPLFVLEPEFRKGDSTYSFLSAKETKESNARIRAAIEDGSVYDEMKRAAKRAVDIGEAVIISARKS